MPPYLKPLTDPAQMRRIVEALLFAADAPLAEAEIAAALPEGADVAALLKELQAKYADGGVRLAQVAGKWQMRTADDLRYLLRKEVKEEKKLSRVALETLAIIAYHQPVTRADIEDIRGVAMSKGTLDKLMEIGWVKVRGRRRVPGRPVTYGVTEEFLTHFGLNSVRDLPGLAELKGAGLLDADLPPGFEMPQPQGQAGGERLPALDEDHALFDGAAEDDAEPPLDMHLPDGPGAARKP
ncbi:MAG TPA: SMC-Scp complex subunit ScpB [Thermopetrobacter sp.]|nr:SMC-Scp complex subunit ScpB [Thermopetrobacter sp.]